MTIAVSETDFESVEPDCGEAADVMRWMGTSIATSGILDEPFALVFRQDGSVVRTRSVNLAQGMAYGAKSVVCGMHGVFDTKGRLRHVFHFDEGTSEDEGTTDQHCLATYFDSGNKCLLGLVVVRQKPTYTSLWSLSPDIDRQRMEWFFHGKRVINHSDPIDLGGNLGKRSHRWFGIMARAIAANN